MVKSFYLNFKNSAGLMSMLKLLDRTKVWRIRIDEYDQRTLEQNEKQHAMLGDIAKQCKHLNKALDADSWKRLAVAQFRADSIASNIPRVADYWRKQGFELIPSLDGSSLVQLGAQTRDFPKYVTAAFIEWLYHYGSENGVVWSEPEKYHDQRMAA